MALEIHALMENPHNVYAISRRSIEKKVRACRKFLIASTYVVTAFATARIIGDDLDRRLDLAEIDFRLVDPPMGNRIIPNVLNVGLSAWRELDAAHE
nr:hypothetical protein [Methyloferula stellata]